MNEGKQQHCNGCMRILFTGFFRFCEIERERDKERKTKIKRRNVYILIGD